MNAASGSIATTDRSARIGVIGGGIAGMAAALAFARAGAEVTVYEQAQAVSEVGAGLQITPNGARCLRALGVFDALAAVTQQPRAIVLGDLARGRELARLPIGAGTDYLVSHRAVLLDCLLKGAREQGVRLETGALRRPDQIDADLVIAADGIRSGHRTLLNPGDAPRFSGMVAYRALAAGSAGRDVQLWLGSRKHLVSYPLSPSHSNLVGVVETEVWQGDTWSEPSTPEGFRAHFPQVHPLGPVSRWGLMTRGVAKVWHDGRSVLVGDAAHPTLPFLAQGANMALEDAVVLSRLWALDRDGALSRFQALREPRVRRIVAASTLNGRIYHLSGLSGSVTRRVLGQVGRLAPGLVMRRAAFIHDFDATDVALG